MPELTCPVCGGALHREERSLRCGAGHCYDIARQGYVNLLRTNRSKDKRHGDDKRMVAARTAFLDAGYYAPLRDAIAAAATEYTSGDADVLDAGCGEGYYTAHVLHTLQAQGASPSVCGVDISRDALICAHRRAPELTRHLIEVRGIGIVDVRYLYGVGAVNVEKTIDFCIELELWNENTQYDRTGTEGRSERILDVEVPTTRVPVSPGRNLSVVVEVAARNFRLRRLGYNASEELNWKTRDAMGR